MGIQEFFYCVTFGVFRLIADDVIAPQASRAEAAEALPQINSLRQMP